SFDTFVGIKPIDKVLVTFIVDDSINTGSYTNNIIMWGTFNPATGKYSANWNGDSYLIMSDTDNNHIWLYQTYLEVNTTETYQWKIGTISEGFVKYGNSFRLLDSNPVNVYTYWVDKVKPTIKNVYVIDRNHLILVFSEQITKSTAENKNNYSINNGLSIEAVSLTSDNSSVYISTSLQMPLQLYTITVNNITDMNNNTILSNSQITFNGSNTGDTTPPFIVYVTAIDSQNIKVVFSEIIRKAEAEEENNYFISGGLNVINAILSNDSKTVNIQTSNQVGGYIYTITISNIYDSIGNKISDNSTATFIGQPLPKAKVVFIADDASNINAYYPAVIMRGSF
ncbi:MAG TPA: hypothetical protein PKX90_13115, partial [bacterium]|nr:hypothetical protein [bacterium]